MVSKYSGRRILTQVFIHHIFNIHRTASHFTNNCLHLKLVLNHDPSFENQCPMFRWLTTPHLWIHPPTSENCEETPFHPFHPLHHHYHHHHDVFHWGLDPHFSDTPKSHLPINLFRSIPNHVHLVKNRCHQRSLIWWKGILHLPYLANNPSLPPCSPIVFFPPCGIYHQQ